MIDALMALAEFEQDHNEVSQAEAWGRMFALTLINLPLHMNDETYNLRHNPLCVFCKAQGRIPQAEQVDHIEVCGDDPRLQRDPLNIRSLCRECHRIRHGARQKRVIGVDGWPVE